MDSSKKNIVIDLDRMKYPNTGMYNFCLNLYRNFSRSDKFTFVFYKHKKTQLDDAAQIINIKPTDKFILIPPKKADLWHTTSQLSKRVPSTNIPWVYTVHDLNFLYSQKPQWKKERILSQIKKNIERADFVTFISNFACEDVKKYISLDGKKHRIVHNGVALEKHDDFNNPRIIPNGDFLYTLGVVDPKKNIHVILNLLIGNELKLIISGIISDADYKERILSKAQELNVSERIFFTGAVSDEEKYWYLKNCKAFVFTSISEGFGLPPIEAMRLGRPVFLSNLTSLPEVGGNAAYYFENFETAHMKSVFEKGMDDYVSNNRKDSIIAWSQQFTWEKACEEYIKIYEEVLK